MPQDFEIKIPHHIEKVLKKIPLPWRERIWKLFDALEKDPFLGKKMEGEYSDRRRVRVTPYRVTYVLYFDQRIIKIVEVERRGNMSYD